MDFLGSLFHFFLYKRIPCLKLSKFLLTDLIVFSADHCEPPSGRSICVPKMLEALNQGVGTAVLVDRLRSEKNDLLFNLFPPVHAGDHDKGVKDDGDDSPDEERPGVVHGALRDHHRHMFTQ